MPLRTHLEKYNLVCTSMKKYDYLIVGSGLFGATFAHLAHQQGKTCLVIDKRPHLGGNIYCENIEGINVHKYGAHIFHTSNKEVWNFVNSIVEFNRYTNSPVANYKGKLYNLPFNMNTFYQMWGVTTPAEAQAKIDEQKAEAVAKMKADGVSEPRNLEEQAQVLIGKDIYERLIKGYTEKQWGRKCTDLPAFIIKRLPVRLIFDNNYFNDKYGDDFDVLFGPAYKGIPLSVVTAIAFSELYGKEIRYCSDRKEEKDHGADKGSFLGSKLKDGDRVVMIEDVTTSGKSMEETVPKVRGAANVEIVGLMVSLDRMEVGKGGVKCALDEVHDLYGFETNAIVTMAEVIEHLYNKEYKGQVIIDDELKKAIDAYYSQYGAK